MGSSPLVPPTLQTALPSVGAQRTLTIVSNRCNVAPQLEQMVLRARLQLSAKAYVHHYEQHGVSADYMAERLEVVQRVVDDYGAMSTAVGRRPSRMGAS